MFEFKVTPKNLLLGVLQTSTAEAIPIKVITHIGELFGFTSNVMRVNVTRLLGAGVLGQDERGCYRLKKKNNLMAQLIDGWHLGEGRRVEWDRTWFMVCLPNKKSVAGHKDNINALSYLGFKASDEFIWVRPNNLTYSRQICWDYLLQLGLTPNSQLFVVAEADQDIESRWLKDLWPIQQHQKNYRELLKSLINSQQVLKTMPLDQAVVESFIFGSKVVNTLAIDPLLPEQMMSTKYRERLTDAMHEYDLIGQKIWWQKFTDLNSEEFSAPGHLNFLQ